MDTDLRPEDKIDERQQEIFNPTARSVGSIENSTGAEQANYDREFDGIASNYYDREFDGIAANYGKTEDPSENIKNLKDKESIPYKEPDTTTTSRPSKIVNFAKSRKGAATGAVGGIGIAGIILMGMSTPFSLLMHFSENGVNTNDSRSSMLTRRLGAWIDKKFSRTSSPCNITTYKCRMGKIPNKMLAGMAANGVQPIDADGNRINIEEKRGYIDKNPAKYEISDPKAEGGKRIIPAGQFATEYRKNPTLRSDMKKVVNMRFSAWTGKNIKKIFYDKFKFKRNGGIAADDEKLDKKNVNEKLDERLKPPSDSEPDTSKEGFRKRFENLLRRTGKKAIKTGGSPTLLLGTAYCTTVGLPGFVAGAYRAIQLAQILTLVHDIMLSPSGKAKAMDIKENEMSAIGDKLTESVKGKSALDSPVLLSAIGVNTAKTAKSKYAPGYGVYSSPAMQGVSKLDQKSKGFCNKLLSPAGQVTAATIEAGVSASTAGFGAIGIAAIRTAVKTAALIGIADKVIDIAASSNLTKEIADRAFDLGSKVVGNYIEGARGEKLGDALGIGMLAYFSRSGLAGGSAVLKKDQVGGFSKVMAEVNNEYKEEAIATLSPFDTSSQYTFLGSIVSNLSLRGVLGGSATTSLSSIGSLVLSTPSSLLSPISKASSNEAAEAAKKRCDHGEMFDIQDDIAVNASGYPCVGIPAEYVNMSIDDVYNQVSDDLDENSGEWKSDGDIAEVVSDCSEGDLESIGGCAIEDKKRAAQSIYQYDKQASDILDGSDEDESSNTSSSTGGSTIGVASYNFCHEENNGCPIENSNKKGSIISSVIKGSLGQQLDIIGAQEVTRNTLAAITSATGYSSYPTPTGNPPQILSKDKGRAILWNSSTFTLASSGRLPDSFDMVGNDGTPAKGDKAFPWVQLKPTSDSSKSIYVLSIHSPRGRYAGPGVRIHNAKMALQWAQSVAGPDSTIIITGDFNRSGNQEYEGSSDNGTAGPKSKGGAYCELTGGILINASDLARNVAATEKCPTNNANLIPFDQIYVSSDKGIKASNWKHLDKGSATKTGTDHSPAYVTLEIPGVGSNSASASESVVAAGGSIDGDDFGQACKSGNSLGAPCDGQCVSFVKYRLKKHIDKNKFGTLGSGGVVTRTLSNPPYNYKKDTIPAVNSVFSSDNSTGTGHTGMVSKVNADGSIVVEEYNITPKKYGTRTISVAKQRSMHFTFAHTEVDYK